MIKNVIFDLDGTLLNTLPTIKHHLNTTLTHFGYREVDDEQTKRYIGDGAYQLLYRALTEQGETREDVIRTVLSYYMRQYELAPLHLTEIYEGIPEMLAALSRTGISLLVISNKPDVAAIAVVDHYFPDSFTLVHGGIDGIPLKPDPALPLRMLSEISARAGESAFVGDTAVDINTARNMGAAMSFGVLWGFRDEAELTAAGASVTVSHPSEIVKIITEHNGGNNAS